MINIMKPFPSQNILNGKYLFRKFPMYCHEEEPPSLQKKTDVLTKSLTA